MTFAILVPFAAILGACLGSFCNVLIVRMKEERSLGGRSACMQCQKTLTITELIPLFSWIALRGKCRHCKTPIHIQYPVVELAGAAIGLYAIAAYGHIGAHNIAHVLFTVTFLFFLLVITAFDMRWQLVPTVFVVGGGVLFAGWNVLLGQAPEMIAFGILSTGGVLAALTWGSRGKWMGEGDPFVGATIGAALGWPLGPIALLVGFVIGGIIAMLLLCTGRVTRKTHLPFVPFLALGAFLVYAGGTRVTAFIAYAFGI